ncbi:MAG: type II secretion system protein [Verrucomicrobia bacterium]|nr:type II secretion system protein [Verrucomicrobiota bacterium]
MKTSREWRAEGHEEDRARRAMIVFPVRRPTGWPSRVLVCRASPLGPRLAFTLIELMLAVSIMAIIMTIGLPAFVNAMKKEDLRKAVSDVIEGCSHARAQAVLKGVPMEFVIRAEDGSLSVQSASVRTGDSLASKSDSQQEQPTAESATAAASFHGQLPHDVGIKLLYVNFQDKMESPEARVRFFPNGTCDECTIILFSSKGEKKVSLEIVTGLADVETLR